MNINFPEYKSDPQIIIEILYVCNKHQTEEQLNKYNPNDIKQLIENRHLKKENGLYILSNIEIIPNLRRSTELFVLLFPVMTFKRNIIQLNKAWIEFTKLIQTLAEKSPNPKNINITESDSIDIEFHIHHIFSILFKIREALKNNFIKTDDKNNITRDLVEPYTTYQMEYNNLLDSTINIPKVKGFSDFFRNRIEHGGYMIFSIISRFAHNIMIYSAVCDYSMLAKKSKSNVKDNLHQYYRDIFVYYMECLANGILWNEFTTEQLQQINSELKVRTNKKHIEVQQLTIDEIQFLLKDKNFILFNYDLWIKRGNSALGQFNFDLSECIGTIYDTHINLYEQLYLWVIDHHKSNINEFIQINNDFRQFYPNRISPYQGSFDLQIDKNIFRCLPPN